MLYLHGGELTILDTQSALQPLIVSLLRQLPLSVTHPLKLCARIAVWRLFARSNPCKGIRQN